MSSRDESLKEKAQNVDQELDEIEELLENGRTPDARSAIDDLESELDATIDTVEELDHMVGDLEGRTKDKFDEVYDRLNQLKGQARANKYTRRSFLDYLAIGGVAAGIGAVGLAAKEELEPKAYFVSDLEGSAALESYNLELTDDQIVVNYTESMSHEAEIGSYFGKMNKEATQYDGDVDIGFIDSENRVDLIGDEEIQAALVLDGSFYKQAKDHASSNYN